MPRVKIPNTVENQKLKQDWAMLLKVYNASILAARHMGSGELEPKRFLTIHSLFMLLYKFHISIPGMDRVV